MSFFNILKSSVYGPAFYRSLADRKLSFSVKYFVLLAIIAAAFSACVVSISAVPGVRALVGTTGPAILDEFPSDLVVTLANGKVSMNRDGVVFLPLQHDIIEKARTWEIPEIRSAVVFDTMNDFSLDRFREYKTFVLVGRDSIAFVDRGGASITSLAGVPDVVIDKQFTEKTAAQLRSFLPWVAPAVLLGLFLLFLLSFTTQFFSALLGAVVVFLALKVLKRPCSFRNSFQIALHAITIGILVAVLSTLGIPAIPFLPTILFFAVLWVNVLFPPAAPAAPSAEQGTVT